MSQRDGHLPGGGATPADPTAAPPGPFRPAPGPPFTTWEAVFPALPTDHQQQLLDLAHRQGFLLVDQLPDPPPPPDPVGPVLAAALASRLPPLPFAAPLTPSDPDLDAAQRDAIGRADRTPDFALVVGPAGTGKTRVAVELVRRTTAAGGKVLYLTAEPDAMLARLATASAYRGRGPGEAAAVSDRTFAAREAALRDSLSDRARTGLATAYDLARKLEAAVPKWDDLAEAVRTQAGRAADRTALAAQLDAVAEDVKREADAAGDSSLYFVQRVRGAVAAQAKRLAALDAEAADVARLKGEAEARRAQADVATHDLRPKAEAVAAGRWYSLGYWKGRGDTTLVGRLAEADQALAAATAELAELAVREQKLAADRQLAAEDLAAERARYIDGEVARRRADLTARLAELDSTGPVEGDPIAGPKAWLRDAGFDADLDPAAGAADARARLDAARRDLDFARGWAAEVEAGGDEIVRRGLEPVGVVVGPVGCATADPDVAAAGPFDLLIVDDAGRLTEAEFLPAARLARRWVLTGEPPRDRGTRPDLFARLAVALGREAWGREGDRLVCRLHPVRGPDRRKLECEPVADAPDIELRLFTPPGEDPVLAEVAFPARMTPAAAREYLARELEEVIPLPAGRSPVWEATPSGVVVRFGPGEAGAEYATLAPGVREELCGLETRAVHFDAPDWDRPRAAAWAAERLCGRDCGRVVALTHPYRACPGLAAWLNAAFSLGFTVPAVPDPGPHVEFLAVPDADPRRRRDHNGRAPRVGGAGYEIDLADARQRAALPAEFADLPPTGFVNLPEAQALVRHLESLPTGSVAVSSPFPAQRAVLAALVARSGRLGHVRVVGPADGGPECDLLAVSLTRSHVARAVTFGEAPAVLAGLLTRQARRKLLFAGDPGTLARRLQWEGPVDHLSAAEAGRERAWVAALADCPRVSPHPRHRHAAEGARA